jgi:hypothetical protein
MFRGEVVKYRVREIDFKFEVVNLLNQREPIF